MSDKVRQRGQADSMAFDIDKAALPALWKSDPAFVSLAKYLYGDDVTLDQVQKDLFGKMDPGPSDVHAQQPLKVGRKKKPLVVDERGDQVEKLGPGAMRALNAIDEHVINGPIGHAVGHVSDLGYKNRRLAGHLADQGDALGAAKHNVIGHALSHPIRNTAAVTAAGATTGLVVHHHYYGSSGDVQKNLVTIGKAFVGLVEKAYDAGLIDDKGNLNEVEIEKSRQYMRDHGGRFASSGVHTGRMVAGLAAAGALAGTGAVLGAKAPKALKYAGESIKFVGQHLKSADPVERHVARSLLPHALKATGKAVGTAGVGATASAGAVYEGTRTYNDMREHAVRGTKAARLEEVEKFPGEGLTLKAGAKYVSAGTQAGEHLSGYAPKHASGLTRIKRLRRLAGAKVEETALDPATPARALREAVKPIGEPPTNVSKDWTDYDRKRQKLLKDKTYLHHNRQAAAAGVGSLAAGVGGLAAFESAGGQAARAGNAAKEQHLQYEHAAGKGQQALDLKRSGLNDTRATSLMDEAIGHHEQGQKMGEAARTLWRSGNRRGRAGIALGAASAGLMGVTAYENHKAGQRERQVMSAKRAPEVTWEGEFSKVDDDKQQVFGWASVTQMDGKPVIDLQGDYIEPDEIEKAAYDYVVKARVGGDMHSRVDEWGNKIEKADKPFHASDLIESMVFTPEKCDAMGVSKDLSGSWWVGFKVNDPDVWDLVKSGERTGFSIHGAGLRKSIDIEELDPEAELIGKAYQESADTYEFISNLNTLGEVTGSDTFTDLAKHLHHGIDSLPQVNAQQSRNAGVYGSGGSAVGALAGGAIGAKFGHMGEGAGLGAGVGGLTGTGLGVAAGREKKQRPERPASVHAAMGSFGKAVSTTNRMGGAPGQRQDMYQQQALQQATEMLAPQVAQHVQALQEQRWQQQMMEQQMLQQQAQQAPQDFSVRMGPYANHQNGNAQQQTQNPLAPSQQGPTTGTQPQVPQTPQTFSV